MIWKLKRLLWVGEPQHCKRIMAEYDEQQLMLTHCRCLQTTYWIVVKNYFLRITTSIVLRGVRGKDTASKLLGLTRTFVDLAMKGTIQDITTTFWSKVKGRETPQLPF
jgi:hypothetical protein